MEFKVGDKVMCINRSCSFYLREGSIYTVGDIFESNNRVVYIKELSYRYTNELFKLVSGQYPTLRSGYKLEVK